MLSPRWIALGGVLTLVLAFPGLLRPQIVSIPYLAWNKLAREFARCSRILVMGICYYVIFAAVGRAGSKLMLSRPLSSRSLWIPLEALSPAAYVNQYSVIKDNSPGEGWISTYLLWAVRSGNLWACCLLPFLLLLSALESDQNTSEFPTSTYTLF